MPPLRTEEDRIALLDALEDGTIDCIATGHAPHTDYEKDVEFDYAPFGVIGLETALSIALAELYHSKRLPLMETLSLLTHRPAEILKLPKGALDEGTDADVVLFDPDELWTPTVESFHSKSSNSPWIGRQLKGRIKQTYAAGKLVYQDATLA